MEVDESPTSSTQNTILPGKITDGEAVTLNTDSNVNVFNDKSTATRGDSPARQNGLQVRTNLPSSRQISDQRSGGLQINLRKATEPSLSPSYTPGYPTSHTFGKPDPTNPSPIVAIDSGSITRGPRILSPNSHTRSPSSLSNRFSRNLNHPYSLNMPAERRSSAGNAYSSPSERHSSPVSIAPDVMASPSGMRQRGRKEKPAFPSPRSRGRESVDYSSLETPSIFRIPDATPTQQSFLSPSVFGGRQLNFAPPISNARGEPATPISAVTPGSARQAIPARNRQRAEAIPKAYVLKSLHNLAPHFWNNATTADCRLLVPIRNPDQSTPSPSQYATFRSEQDHHLSVPHSAASATTPTPTSAHPFGGVAPNLVNTLAFAATEVKEAEVKEAEAPQDRRRASPLMTLNLHRDYLVTQSSLLSQLLESRVPAIRTSPSREPPPSAPSHVSSFQQVSPPPLTSTDGKFPAAAESIRAAAALKGARILPTPNHVPTTVWLPLPDPSSLGVLIHYLYWGDSSKLENALSTGDISWQGVVKNIEYLGLDNNVKRVLGSWWRRWVKVAAGRSANAPPQSANGNGQRRGMDEPMREEAEEDEDADGEMQTSDEESENSLRPRLKKINGRRVRKREVEGDEQVVTMVDDREEDNEVAEKMKGL